MKEITADTIITLDDIKAKRPCEEGWGRLVENHRNWSGTLEEFMELQNMFDSDKSWMLGKFLTPEQLDRIFKLPPRSFPEAVRKVLGERTKPKAFEWKPGTWYKPRGGEKRLFIGFMNNGRLAIEGADGWAYVRYPDGRFKLGKDSTDDILPIEWTEPKKPHRHESEIWISSCSETAAEYLALTDRMLGFSCTWKDKRTNEKDRKFKVIVEEVIE